MQTFTKRLGLRHAALAAVFALAACAQPKPVPEEPTKPVNKTMVVTAGPNANSYNDGANPVVIRIYQLSKRTGFEAADFWKIFNGTSKDLAGIVLDQQSLASLYPGESRLVALDLVPEAAFLGVFGEFADFESQTFRATAAIDATTVDRGVTINVTASGVSIKTVPETPLKKVAPQPGPSEKEPSKVGKFFKKIFGAKE